MLNAGYAAVVEGRPLRHPRLPCCGMSMGWFLRAAKFELRVRRNRWLELIERDADGGNSCDRALSSVHGGGGGLKYSTPNQQQAQIGTITNLLAGGVAGAVSKTCTAPLARLTILFQVQGMHADAVALRNASIWREASRIACEEGFRAFWRGNLVTIAHRLLPSAFMLTNATKIPRV
ncbi:ADP,ATP carrier protein-like [Asparagus officinalis]|uniref:ADP,ATP carrier protein-like n=1 Tax=Asparagus officinalis TaxID=4686 RepID=UPI00098E6A8A|nr:ADP,ATP carrier protein-like [Asparagus officinalis]